MAWRVNPEKERMKLWLIAAIESSITNLSDRSNKIQDLMCAADRAVGGSAVGTDHRLNDCSRRSLAEISESLSALRAGLNYADLLKTEEWVPDD
jgi:hypothetical protein